jgi:hypothetical protein
MKSNAHLRGHRKSSAQHVSSKASLAKTLDRLATQTFKAGRRPLRVLVRKFTGIFPGLTKRYQRFRYRNWPSKVAAFSGRPPQPDFIIIGAPKCGTSWLQSVLGQLPDIKMVPDEIEYFSFHCDKPPEWYFEHFVRRLEAERITDSESFIIGEKSARYCAIAPDQIRRVRSLLPHIKLILMTRDPVARHWAHAKRNFEKRALNNRETAALRVPRERLFAYFRETRPLGEFSNIIANWTSVFPASQLLILSQEKALASPEETLRTVLAHIGASRDYDPSKVTLLQRQVNRGPRVEMPADVSSFLENMFAEERKHLHELFGKRSFVYGLEGAGV